jgi:hypothetical protein
MLYPLRRSAAIPSSPPPFDTSRFTAPTLGLDQTCTSITLSVADLGLRVTSSPGPPRSAGALRRDN